MMPAVATLAEVTSVAAATIAMRSGPVGDAERARLFLRQRHHVHPPAQREQHDGAERHRTEQRQQIGDASVAARLPSSQNVMAGSWL